MVYKWRHHRNDGTGYRIFLASVIAEWPGLDVGLCGSSIVRSAMDRKGVAAATSGEARRCDDGAQT